MVDCGVEAAFEIWTRNISSWWPAGHSLSGHTNIEIFIEGRIGGRFFERTSDGVEYEWGKVLRWEPPHRLAYEWYLGSHPQRPSRVEIRFTAQEEGRTRVDVEHRGLALLGDLWAARQSSFLQAWEKVLATFRSAAHTAQPRS